MKKTLSLLVTIMMVAGLFQFGFMSAPKTVEAAENVNGTFIAVRFVPVGFDRDGTELTNKDFPWQKAGEDVWGRTGYGMPDSNVAFENNINIPATSVNLRVKPLIWTDFYLDVTPAGGRSTVSEHWYAVYDEAGQLWLDPDGRFNDCRYYEPADPANLNGRYISEECKSNPFATVDPSTGNNTQGPYVLDPQNDRFNATVDSNGNTSIYFWDKNRTGRLFRMGWIDMDDFPLVKSSEGVTYSIVQGNGEDIEGNEYVVTTDWDAGPFGADTGYELRDFVYWGNYDWKWVSEVGGPITNSWGPNSSQITVDDPITNRENTPPFMDCSWYFNSANVDPATRADIFFHYGDEVHAGNIAAEEQVVQDPLEDGETHWTIVDNYNPGEFIYRKGIGAYEYPLYSTYVQEGDVRLTHVSIYKNGETKNYPPNSIVKATDWDCYYAFTPTNSWEEVNPETHLELFRFPIHFNKDGVREAYAGDQVHADNQKKPSDYNFYEQWYTFEPGEWIYQENGNILSDHGFVTVGDYRLTNVDDPVEIGTMKKERNRGYISSDVSLVESPQMNGKYVPRVQGDLLVLAEVLFGGCNQPAYNLSVETDVWEGMVPSVTAARLRSPNNDVKVSAQTVQKNTVLGQKGSDFNIPATTFQNVNVKYREYIGVEIWKDNGIDNNWGINFAGTPPPPIDTLYPYNLSDDYRAGRTGEEYLGANDGMYAAKDFGNDLLPFPSDIMFYDTERTDPPQYGCGETIYKNNNGVDPNTLIAIVDEGDKRLTAVTVNVGNNVIKYKAGTTVAAGDADVSMPLTDFHAWDLFRDENWPNDDIPYNWTYDVGEYVYKVADDVRNGFVGEGYKYFMGVRDPADTDPAPDMFTNILYADIDNSGTASPGDIRVFDPSGRYENGSVMNWKDLDCLGGWYYIDANDLSLKDVPVSGLESYNIIYRGEDAIDWAYSPMAYLDVDGSGDMTVGDVRLTRILTYKPFTAIKAGDTDYMAGIDTGEWSYVSGDFEIALFDTVYRNLLVLQEPSSNTSIIDDGDLWLTSYSVRTGDIRLTEVTVSDVTYSCGSKIGDNQDFWINQSTVYGLSMGKNCDFRYIDWEVYPSDQIGMSVKIDKPFQVEQTSQIDITIDPAPRAAYWEDGVYHEAEKVYIMLTNTEGPTSDKIYEDYKVITADNPVATFQFTPYRGTCPPNGQYSGFKKVWENGKWILKDYDLRVRIVAIKDDGGVTPAPETHYIDEAGKTKDYTLLDPFWKLHDNKGDLRWGHIEGTKAWGPPRYQVPPFPEDLMNKYDCYAQKKYNVAPEGIKFNASKKCVGVLDQRFPNLTLKLEDVDNPNDVNDPNGIRISVPDGEEVAVFYNAHNAGIDYLFTGFAMSNGVVTSQKVIVQVNLDGTYLYWNWDDVGPHPGMLDAGDVLWNPNPKYPNEGPERIPNCVKVEERPNFIDADCSQDKNQCKVCGDGFEKLGYVSYGDIFGDFFVSTFGVPSYLMNYGERTTTDEGGEIQVAILARDAATKLEIRVWTENVIFDYNSTITHPPYFVVDKPIAPVGEFDFDVNTYPNVPYSGAQNWTTMGIDYCGIKSFKVLAPDPYVNFVEMSTVDHALQNSQVNYTAGPSALSKMNVPTPQIQYPYNPLILDVGKDCRAYPGGQTHTGRIQGVVTAGGVTRTDQDHCGWNAYPAIWWWYWYDDVDYNNFTDFNRLGTEFFPLTDYGLYFILKDIDGNHLSFDEDTPIDYKLRRVVISGPFAQPKIFDDKKNTVTSDYEYNGLRHVPIAYDWTGEVVIDSANMNDFEHAWGQNWTNVDRDGGTYRYTNPLLVDNKQLNYTGLENIFRFEEWIPISYGKLNVSVTLWDGTVKIFQDCCAEPPTDGIDIHALEVSSDKDKVTADVDNKIEITVKEYEVMQSVQPTNDAFVYAWQDRGILNPRTNLYDGAGDGWVTNPPHSSDFSDRAPQYFSEDDLNEDGKISFGDKETEIIGSYDLATNTWTGGVIDARTFQRNNGVYVFDLSEANGSRIDTVGVDFGGDKGDPDHVISEFETLPVMVTAYKYGDDNNDRSFRPLYSFPGTTPQFSHEVYLSGQAFIEVAPIMDLSVSVQPNLLTAGVTPELVDPVSPLSFSLTDEEGEPVDLTRGVPDSDGKTYVEDDDIWNHLFKDIHPDPLPEYYWVRTDLHNDDNTKISNRELYSTPAKPFQPIKIDFSLAKDGKYAFRGFCANDEGEFDVYIYTPDRKHAAKANVNVVLPTVEYSIVNTEDPSGTEYQVPGEPDFVLTAADNRIYKITITAKNAQGLLLKGVSKGVSTCGGGIKNTARFTPYSTRPASFDFTEKDRYLFAEHFLQDLYPFTLNIGFDFNDNGKVDWRNAELFSLGAFNHTQRASNQITLGKVYYNTCLVMYDEESIKGGWDVTPNPNLTPPVVGWGLGAIYNSAHKGGYLFSDIDDNKRLDYHDSLGLDVNAQTTFYIFAEDLCWVAGLVGDNIYCNNPDEADLAGYPPPNKQDPASVEKRFHRAQTSSDYSTNDGSFLLDWEAFPNKEVQIGSPTLRVLRAETSEELGKDLVNPSNYDIVYAIENHLIVEVRPADNRDREMHEDGRVYMIGNQHQTAIYGHTKKSATDPKVMVTTLHFTPTGLGEDIAGLGYFNKNKYYLTAPYDLKNTSTYTVRNIIEFDSVVGLQVHVIPEGPLHPNKTTGVNVKVTEIGTQAPVEGANVTAKGPGVNASKKTDKDGMAVFEITPNDKGMVVFTATKEGRIIGVAELPVIPDTSAPWLQLDPVNPLTNNPNQKVTGRTNPGNKVTLNGTPAQVNDDGSFTGTVTLKEGLNTIVGEAVNPAGLKVRKLLTVTLDTTPPSIFLDDPGKIIYSPEIDPYQFTGRVDIYSTVTINGVKAEVVHDIWKAKVAIKPGINTLTMVAVDQAGNSATATAEVKVWERTIIKLTVGNVEWTKNGEALSPLESPAEIRSGRTIVPLRAIAEAFGADVQYDNVSRGINITLGDEISIVMTVGDVIAYVNGEEVILDSPPVIQNGRALVPIRFIGEAFGAEVLWDAPTRTVTIIRDTLP
jgi:hypothetical protein